MDKVSIIIPIYNVEAYLSDCLESCIRQTYPNIEIIAVNDGSTDGSLRMIQDFQRKDSRIILVDQKNGGAYEARFSGVRRASGRFLFFCDGDDFLPLDAIERLHEKAVAYSVDLVVANFYKKDGDAVFPVDSFFREEGCYDKIDFQKLLIDNQGDSLCGRLIARSLFDMAVWRPSFACARIGEDQVVMLQLCNHVSFVYCWSGYSYYYVQRPTSVVHDTDELRIADRSFHYMVALVDLLSAERFEREIRLRILYRALSMACLYLRSWYALDSDRTVVVRHYVRDFYIRDRAMRDFMFSQNRLTYIMLFICYLSPALAECVSSLRRVFQRK